MAALHIVFKHLQRFHEICVAGQFYRLFLKPIALNTEDVRWDQQVRKAVICCTQSRDMLSAPTIADLQWLLPKNNSQAV